MYLNPNDSKVTIMSFFQDDYYLDKQCVAIPIRWLPAEAIQVMVDDVKLQPLNKESNVW